MPIAGVRIFKENVRVCGLSMTVSCPRAFFVMTGPNPNVPRGATSVAPLCSLRVEGTV